MTSLFKHQEAFLESRVDKTTLVWSCGTGKTRTAIEWANQDVASRVLIICPKALKVNWQREVDKWAWGLTYWRIVTKEEFRRDCKIFSHYNTIIVDEVHNGFLTPQFKSQMSKALRAYLKVHEVPRVLLLTATPYTSNPWNIYNLAVYTGHAWNYRKFDEEFFDHIRMGMRIVPVAKKNAQPKLVKALQKIANIVDIHDVMDVPLQNHLEPEYFALTKEQEKAIKEAYDPLPIVRYTKQHEIENGILLGNEFQENEYFETDKIERVKTICEENKKVAIVCRYNLQIDAYKQILSQETKRPIYIIRGEVRDRDTVTREAEEAKEAIVLIQADCAEGYELPSFELCIFASQSYSYTKWEQICGRFLRMNKPSPTTFMYLLTDGDSIDQAVYDAVKRKEDFKIELYGNA